MKLTFPYNQAEHKADAYKRIHTYIHSESFEKLELSVDIEENEPESIKATGKGFDLLLVFADQQMVLMINLSFFLKPLANKISSRLNTEFSQLV